MSDLSEHELDFLGREYERLAGNQMRYYDSVVATERLALAGAAAVAAFLVTDLPSFAAGQARVLSALPAAIVCLAGLRCLTIYLVMNSVADHLRNIEDAVFTREEFGFDRRFMATAKSKKRLIEATTTAFWAIATGAAFYFWWAYAPPPQ